MDLRFEQICFKKSQKRAAPESNWILDFVWTFDEGSQTAIKIFMDS